MKLNNIIGLCLFFVSATVFSQSEPEEHRLDGIGAVIGSEVVLLSDIERDYFMAKAQGYEINDPCEFLNNTLVEKMLLTKAKSDTLIKVTEDQVKRMVDERINYFSQMGNEKEMLDYFGYATMAEFRSELSTLLKDQRYTQAKHERVTSDVDATPDEVRQFFDEYSSELPDVKEEVELSHIVVYPEISPENEQKIVDQLLQMKKEIEEGASFATKAILYSEDPGSKSTGGLIQNVSRGMMVPEFDAVVFNLEEGEISEPFKTDFGYHIAMLEKRKGQILDLRHILIQLKPTQEEIEKSKLKLDSLRLEIEKGDLTFKEVAKTYSVDKYTKFNAGKKSNPQTRETRFERESLPVKEFSAILGLEEGGLSEVYEDEYQNRVALFLVSLDKVIPAHKINFETDFSRLKNIAIQNKKQDVLLDWIKKQIPDTFIKIDKEFDQCKFPVNWRKE